MTPLVDTARALEERLVAALALADAPLPPELASARGSWRGAPVSLAARAWAGSAVRWARAVHVEGGALEIANVLALPGPRSPLPVLGVDLVRLRDGSGLAAADLSPIVAPGAERDRQLAALARHVPPSGLPAAGDLPLWARRIFSPHALFVRVAAGDEARLWPPLAGFADALAELAAAPAPAGDHAAAQIAYLAAHRDEDRFLAVLRHVFAPALAARLVGELLFPRWWPR